MNLVRLWVICFIGFGFIALSIAGAIALYSQSHSVGAVTAPGIVAALNDGPYHANVRVTPNSSTPFEYDENASSDPLAVGQHIIVRYQPSNPTGTAVVASRGVYRTALSFVVLAFGFWLAALVSPPLVRRFPNVLGFPIYRR